VLQDLYAGGVETLRLALAQVNPTVGDISGNVSLCLDAVQKAASQGADVVLLPEMVITGYPIDDLALRPSFQAASSSAITELAEKLAMNNLGEILVIAGFLRGTDDSDAAKLGVPRGAPMNSAAVIYGGKIHGHYNKHHLPNYGVFDEFRHFVSGDESVVVRAFGADISIAICEDLWQDGGPVSRVKDTGASLLLVLNGSPYERNKDDVRHALVQKRASQANCTLAYVNMVGGQDDLVFDGDSIVVSPTGEILARANQFVTETLILDVPIRPAGNQSTLTTGEAVIVLETKKQNAKPPITPNLHNQLPEYEELYSALVLSLRDYVTKNGFKSVLFGLSGGIDSALVAAIACDAIGPDRVFAVSLPSEYSSEHSKSDAAELAARTGLNLRTVPIAPLVQAYLDQLGLTGLAEENLQARVRGTTLMGISNQEGHLVLATGNKSELSVGYSTIYGDAVGGFAPIMDVPKVDVWELAKWRNAKAKAEGKPEPIPESSITKPPSAELRPGQKDSDSLPDYDLLDAILFEYVEHDRSADEIVAMGYPAEVVVKTLQLTDQAEYKRRQYPPGPKVSGKAFGRDRRLPMTSKWRES
jgi:NAD+ synthase (glutamine-hydrolysing)